jgi:hypothetical protein
MMVFISRLRRRLRLLARSERGMALPTALFAIIASFGLASAAVMASVDTQRGTSRDQDSKSSIAAADAGASVAMMRLNRYANALSSSTPCLGVSGSTLTLSGASADGWCPAISGTVGSSTYFYRTSPFVTGGTTSVVSTGTDGVVSRRIAISFRATTVGNAFSAEGLIGVDDIRIDNGSNARVGVGTNGNIEVLNNGNVCGNVRYGIGKIEDFHINGTQCTGYTKTQGNVNLPPVSSFIPTDITTNNYNYRLVKCTSTNDPVGCELDSYAPSRRRTSTEPWNPTTRAISASNNASLTLTGGDYFICSLALNNNGDLIISESARVRIFFDTPENCGLTSGAKQIDIQNGSDIRATGYQTDSGKFNLPGFYLLGSPNIQTYAYWSNNAGDGEFLLYGPNTDVVINNNATYTSAIAGKTVHLDNRAIVEAVASQAIPQIGGATIFSRQSYVECIGATASPPNANC